jgi:predicted transcriptional regulator
VANSHRLRILSALAERPTHVSELARRLGLSRPLLYMHLRRLEEAGYLTGRLELSSDGKAMKYFDVVDFHLTIDLATITDAVARSPLTDSEEN